MNVNVVGLNYCTQLSIKSMQKVVITVYVCKHITAENKTSFLISVE